MSNLNKPLLNIIAIAIVGLLITNASGLPTVNNVQSSNFQQLKIIEVNKEPKFLQIQGKTVEKPFTQKLGAPIANHAFNGSHPGFDRKSGGTIVASYYDVDLDNIIWTFSKDDGASFDPGVYWEIGGDYPSIKLWEGDTFFGTHVTDNLDYDGGATYLMQVTDPTDFDTYDLTYWDWSSYGWSNMTDADIACDSSQQAWEWGVSSYIMNTTYGYGYSDGPTIIYADEQTQGSCWIGWYYYDGCDHCDIDIDRSTIYSYAVYDWENTTAGYFELLCRVNDFDQIMNGFDQMYELDYGSDTYNPAVAAGDGNVVILAEIQDAGNKDIVCFYGSDLASMSTSNVINTGDDEVCPDVRHVAGDTFVCTYVANNNLYALITEDAGATWIEFTRKQINANVGAVVEEYKTSDLCTGAVKAMWEEAGVEVTEIWVGEVLHDSNLPPSAPIINGPLEGEMRVEYNYTVCSTDPEGDDIFYYIDWGDGSIEDWIGPYPSGITFDISHSWDLLGKYNIMVKARDSFYAESNWSDPFLMNISFAFTSATLIGVFLEYEQLYDLDVEYIAPFFGLCIQPDNIKFYNPQSGIYDYVSMMIDTSTSQGIILPNVFKYGYYNFGIIIGKFNVFVIPFY